MWKPILAGGLRDRAIAIATRIAEALPACNTPRPDSPPGATLGYGRAGQALLPLYLARDASGDPHIRFHNAAVELLEQAIDLLAERPLPPSLYAGFSGIAWVATHLQDTDAEDACDEIDAIVLDSLRDWRGGYDLIDGLVGMGVYALERHPRPAAAEALGHILDQLDRTSMAAAPGVTWQRKPGIMLEWQHEDTPGEHFDIGLAHGVPGVVAFLGSAQNVGIAHPALAKLLDGATRWLFAQELAAGAPSSFPVWVGPAIDLEPSRLAWCYGDAGVAAALLVAAEATANDRWRDRALRIARQAARRPFDRSGVSDAGLCHGAAGLGHVFNRLYQNTGDDTLEAAARHWLQRALEMERPAGGIGGYQRCDSHVTPPVWRDDPGFLTGSAGIGLALLAATSSVGPDWDRLLLLSAKPTGA